MAVRMKGLSITLLISMIILVDCAGSVEVLFRNPTSGWPSRRQLSAPCVLHLRASRSATASVDDDRFARAANRQNCFDKGPTNILGALVRQWRGRKTDAAGSHVRLFPKRAYARIGSRVRGMSLSRLGLNFVLFVFPQYHSTAWRCIRLSSQSAGEIVFEKIGDTHDNRIGDEEWVIWAGQRCCSKNVERKTRP